MPLYKTINFNSTTKILIWKITESFEQLFAEVQLNDKNAIRLNGMKSELHQRGFLSVRKLLQEAGYNDFDLFYDESGKPHLNANERHTEPVEVSITHSHEFSAIIISDKTAGIDIELQREKILKIADKFNNCCISYANTEDYIKKLTVIWGAKESIFKIRNEPGISFKDHIKVKKFENNDNKTIAELHFDNIIKDFDIFFEEIESFTLVYAFEKV